MQLVRGARAHLRRRRLRLYGTGNGRSGTTTLARMFRAYRVAHEIDQERSWVLATRVLTGEWDVNSWHVRTALRRRDLRYHLEVDVAGHMAPLAPALAQMHDDARFVLLVRDCFSWLGSVVDQRSIIPRDKGRSYFHAKYQRHGAAFAPEESALREADVFPVASFLQGWADGIQRVLDGVPADRLLVVRTEDIDTSLEVLARFAGVPASTLQPNHSNRNSSPVGLVGEVPTEFVVAQARAHCARIMERYWGPDWTDLACRLPESSR